jgi:hypothetical protein
MLDYSDKHEGIMKQINRYVNAMYVLTVIFGIGILFLNFITAIALSRGDIEAALLMGVMQLIFYIGGITIQVLSYSAVLKHSQKSLNHNERVTFCMCDNDLEDSVGGGA